MPGITGPAPRLCRLAGGVMKWMEAVVTFETEDLFTGIALDLVCNIFYESGLAGVVTEDTVPTGEHMARGRVLGYFPVNEEFADRKANLEKMAADLFERNRIRCKIRPTWREYTPRDGEVVIDLDPGMAFGTGTHPTSAMCLAMIEKYVWPGCVFLDVGTGSGILMIAAGKLGAGMVWGIDNDSTALSVALENLEQNGLEPDSYRLIHADGVAGISGQFDIVVANILSEVIVGLARDVFNVLVPGGLFICSGIIEQKREMVEQKLQNCGFSIRETALTESWVCMVAKKG
ncbi:MAG: hypothetical protein B5M56_10825 [Desulfococcus sp. 4484_241]|nr:MAG: hypothetical protein B5M56_10825 [Desulfococcus sp. 4484_241]